MERFDYLAGASGSTASPGTSTASGGNASPGIIPPSVTSSENQSGPGGPGSLGPLGVLGCASVMPIVCLLAVERWYSRHDHAGRDGIPGMSYEGRERVGGGERSVDRLVDRVEVGTSSLHQGNVERNIEMGHIMGRDMGHMENFAGGRD